MKKIVSLFVTAAMLAASCVIPASADDFDLMAYEAAEYDQTRIDNSFDDGTATNAIDNTPAAKLTEWTRLITLDDDSIMTKEFFLSFDFCFDTIDGNVPGSISIEKTKNNGDTDKQGPLFSYDSGNLRTQTGGTSFNTICAITPDTWYRAELEGKMVVSGASVKMTVYDASGAVVGTVDGLNLRQFYANAPSNNGRPNGMKANGVSIDNIKLISENPDAINISASADEIKAGSTSALSYTMTRKELETTKYAVEYSVYDESNTTEVTDGVSVNSDGVVVADISAASQTVTVRASAAFGDKTLTGTKQIKIDAVDVSGEKYDKIEIQGVSEMKAGTEESFTVKATKGTTDVTSSLSDGDVIWSVYNCDDLNPNKSKEFKIENGKLTVADSALPQTVYIRASSASGNVYGSAPVKIAISDNQLETVLASDACETANANATRVESVDGSAAYFADNSFEIVNFGNQGDYVLTELDVKFNDENSGFVFWRSDGTQNSSFYYRGGAFAQETSGGKYSTIMAEIDTSKWYHMEILYSSNQADASINIYEYNPEGNLIQEPVKTALGISTRNTKTFARIVIQKGTYVDNVKISVPAPNQLDIKASRASMFAGETNQVTATVSRNGLPLKGGSSLTWSVLDEEMLPIIDGSVTIDNGLVTVDPMAKEQTITVQAATATGETQTIPVTIMSSEIFSMKNIGVNEERTKVVKLYVDKNFAYSDDVVFVMAFYDKNGVLKAARVLNTYGSNYPIGSNEITVDWEIPGGFDSETESASIFIWTGLK